MYELAKKLFPICRSITGNGVRQTLSILRDEYPEMKIVEVPSGTKVFDWTIPQEWNIRDAYIEDMRGKRIIDFKDNNLHVMGYSSPMNEYLPLDELKEIIYTQPDQPDWIPYVTSYYKIRSGFCMSENQKNSLQDGVYHCVIDSELINGSLTYGEIIIQGDTDEEILLSTYICHPSMANNEVSGPCVAINLAKWLAQLEHRRYTYRILFVPETIGAITYLSQHLDDMKERTIAGFVLSCVGDERTYSYVESKYANTLADRVVQNILKYHYPEYNRYSFLDRGSDERQYNAPGIDLPVCAVCRSKYGEFPEYHTSADNLSLISEEGLKGTFELMKKCILTLEYNRYYMVKCLGEPQLGKRGLYPTVSQKNTYGNVRVMTNFIAYADATIDLIDIANITKCSAYDLLPVIDKLVENDLLEIVK